LQQYNLELQQEVDDLTQRAVQAVSALSLVQAQMAELVGRCASSRAYHAGQTVQPERMHYSQEAWLMLVSGLRRDARMQRSQAELKQQLEEQLLQVEGQFQAMRQEREELLNDLYVMIEHCRELVQDEPERVERDGGQVCAASAADMKRSLQSVHGQSTFLLDVYARCSWC
jgi:hypothetical protein